MPECGTQCYLCDLPVRFDNYSGCSHACSYCFARHRIDISQISKKETLKALMNFISGERTKETNWCDWDIPLHWGGLSDPFQPCEMKYRSSYKCLKIFAEENYPFVVSTKGKIIADTEYLGLIKSCNCVVQISMVCDKYDVLEKSCPTFAERLKILESVSKVARRTIVRVQPNGEEFNLPIGVTTIGDRAFLKNTQISTLNISPTVTSIGSAAFSGCTKLALTILPESVTTIVSTAFSNCSSLTTLTFKGTPTSIASDSFKSCTNLTVINVPWAEGAVANAPWGATKATINYNYVEG